MSASAATSFRKLTKYCLTERKDKIMNMDSLISELMAEPDSTRAIGIAHKIADMNRLQREFNAPIVCPSCGAVLSLEGVDLICTNDDCEEKKLNAMNVFLKKLKIKNVDVTTLRNFKIRTFDELLIPVKHNEKRKIMLKLDNELKTKMFTLPAKTLFCAMNFKGLSEILLNKIIDWCGWEMVEQHAHDADFLDKLYDFAASAGGLPLGIGDITLEKFAASAAKNIDNVKLITDDPRWCGDKTDAPKAKKTGISVCFTGSLNTMGRSKASELAESAGFEVKSSVSKGLTYLVTNNTDSGSSKNKKAKQLGTKIINEEQFLKLINETKNVQSIDDI